MISNTLQTEENHFLIKLLNVLNIPFYLSSVLNSNYFQSIFIRITFRFNPAS